MAPPLMSLDQGMERGLAAFRWLTLGWAWIGVVVERTHLTRPWLAIVGLGAATLVTVAATATVAGDTPLGRRRAAAGVEVMVAAALLLGEALVYDAARHQSLAWAWPAAGIIAVAVLGGLWWGLGAALGLSAASFAGESLLRDEVELTTAAASKTALLVLAAVSAATVARILRAAEREISTARAREEMGRVLHDGVLQTLAVVQRRSDDAELRDLARDQERDLRTFLAGSTAPPAGLAAALRRTVDTVRRRHGIDVAVVLAEDLPPGRPELAETIAGAVGEALTNAAKHSGASRISLYAEPASDGGVYCSVRDDGCGFDRASTTLGRGILGSIEQRIGEVGGRVVITSSPGRGTEVELWAR